MIQILKCIFNIDHDWVYMYNGYEGYIKDCMCCGKTKSNIEGLNDD